MNKYIKGLSLSLLIVFLSGCSFIKRPNNNSSSDNSSNQNIPDSTTQDNNTNTDTDIPDVEIPDNNHELNAHGLTKKVQDGVILHAFNWGLNDIKDNLPMIANAGYSTVQTSPMQVQKDYASNSHWKGQWWKLYQPLSLSIATGNHAIGTKDQLIDLCHEADKYGVKIIVDVVANHLGGGTKESFHSGVKNYEPEIYNQDLIHKGIGKLSDSSIRETVQGYMGDFPDLKTESQVVQDAVLDLLKEYIDCGVDGFRFDAAKHIETPDDGDWSSDFWPYVLNGSTEYALSKNQEEPYFYGEILHTVGNHRSYESYTKMMSVTDSDASEDALKAVQDGNFIPVARKDIYKPYVNNSHAILWGESHDTYSNDKKVTTNISQKIIDQAYAINASRKNAASLYFPRPDNNFKLGTMTKTTDWQSHQISEVNKFHNHFVNASESYSEDVDIFANYKKLNEEYGALIVNTSDSNKINLDVEMNLGEGNYIDKISNHKFVVKNGYLSGVSSECGIIALYSDGSINPPKPSNNPRIRVSQDDSKIYTAPIAINVTIKNADEASYTINDGEPIKINKSEIILLGQNVKDDTVTLKITARKGTNIVTKTFTYRFYEANPLRLMCINIPNKCLDSSYKIAAWAWSAGQDGRFINGELVDDIFMFPILESDDKFLLVVFNKNDELNWSNKLFQTEDITINGQASYDCSESKWK